MDSLTKVKAKDDFYDAVHYRRSANTESTLCGLKVTGARAVGDVSCLSCRQFAAGEF